MKKKYIISFLIAGMFCRSQVVIGDNPAALTNSSVSLEFKNGENRGLVVPWVTSATNVTGAVGGTIVFDISDKIFKYYKENPTAWVALSKNENTIIASTSVDTTGTVDTSLQGENVTEKSDAKAMIGGNPANNNTPGVLVLGDPDKAMILPKVASPHLNIKNPATGMMVYDTSTDQLCIFNGKVWAFWKP